MKHKNTHPLADAQATRLDILYGGTEKQVMRETMKIAQDAIRTLELEERILIFNTLMNKREFEAMFFAHMDKRESLRGACFFGAKLIQRIPFFEKMIPEMKVRMVIINNFDLAVFNSRHRMQLLEFIKWLRDDQNIHVIICMNSIPATWGSQGSLRIMASSIEAIGGHEEAESQETLGVSTAMFDDAMRWVKPAPFVPAPDKTARTTVASNGTHTEPREIMCTEAEQELAEYKVRESDIPREYEPFSDPERYAHSSARPLKNKELARENVSVAH